MGQRLGQGAVKAFLDTHAAAFMAQGERHLFGAAALDLLDRAALFCSPIVRLELTFLHEIGRIGARPTEILDALGGAYGVQESADPMEQVVLHAVGLGWTRDPFDRLLVATASLHRAPFISRDATIHANYDVAVW